MMDIAQTEYLLKNGIDPVDCNNCSKSLVGSVKSYTKHLLICTGHSSGWGMYIGDAGIPQKVKDALERCNKELLNLESGIVITAIDFNYALYNEEVVRIICYPEGCVYELSSDSDFYIFIRDVIMEKEFALHRSKSAISADDNRKESDEIKMPNTVVKVVPTNANMIASIKHNPTFWKTVILVCVHGSRDNRCGRAGPQVIEELNNQLLQRSITKESITVAGCSHIGGHKYAGVLVVYPQGDWYGMISKRNVSDLLEHIVTGKKYLKCWRGNESLTW